MFHFSEDDAMGSDGATSLALVPFDAVPVPPAAGSLADGAHCLQIVALPSLPSLPRSTGEAADAGSKKKSQKDKVKDKETKTRKRSLKTKKLKGRTVKHAKPKPKPKSRSAKGTTNKRKRAVAILKEAPEVCFKFQRCQSTSCFFSASHMLNFHWIFSFTSGAFTF